MGLATIISGRVVALAGETRKKIYQVAVHLTGEQVGLERGSFQTAPFGGHDPEKDPHRPSTSTDSQSGGGTSQVSGGVVSVCVCCAIYLNFALVREMAAISPRPPQRPPQLRSRKCRVTVPRQDVHVRRR